MLTMCLGMFAQKDQWSKGEKVEVYLSTTDLPDASQAAAPAPAWALLVNVVPPAIKSLITKRGKKFTATYSASGESQTFYTNDTSFNTRYKGLGIVRKVDLDDQNKGKEALQAQFKIVQSTDKSAFKFIPHKLSFTHAKAKVKKTVDLTITIEMNSVWTNDKGVAQSKKIGESKFVFKKITLNSEYDDQKLKEKGLNGDWIPIPPKSLHPVKGAGNISFKVTVIETDNFGKRYESIAKFLGDNNDAINTFLMASFGLDD